MANGSDAAPARALLFDLDDTLIVEEPAAVEAFLATARFAATRREVVADELAVAARRAARDLWHAAPTHPYCKRIGISSWEGLWCRFDGEEPDLLRLRHWSSTYRREAWRRGLAEQGIDDPALAEELGERFGRERRDRHEAFADAAAVMEILGRSYRLGLITNGASCLQREKLAASGLRDHFEVIVVSGEFGVAKPDPTIFDHALTSLGCDPAAAVMVGDNLVRDIDGALAAGLDAVWVNRAGDPPPTDRADLVAIADLSELPAALGRIAALGDC